VAPAWFGRPVTGTEGRFSVEPPSRIGDSGRPGRRVSPRPRSPSSGPGNVNVVLKPASVLDSVTVTPDKKEQRLADVPASINIVDRQTIERSPAVGVGRRAADGADVQPVPADEQPLSSHPTSQGVSLRGIGPSGVSRTLVLYDGIPGSTTRSAGGLYWTRVPLESVDRIEVVDTPSSDVYGNYAMGGIINVVGTRAQPRTGELRLQMGNLSSPKGDFYASDVWGKFAASVEGSYFSTTASRSSRRASGGRSTSRANVDYKNTNVKAGLQPVQSPERVLPRRLLH
jgi:outer membrane receptor for ferrienterochelin and colicin